MDPIIIYRGDGPFSSNDFIAIRESYDGADNPDPCGFGRCEDEAVADLLGQEEFRNGR